MTASLENLTIHPDMGARYPTSIDLLSHVLAQIRLTGDRIFSCTLTEKGPLELEAEAAHVCVVTKGALQIEGAHQTPVVVEVDQILIEAAGQDAAKGDVRRVRVVFSFSTLDSDGNNTQYLSLTKDDLEQLRNVLRQLTRESP